MPKAKTAPAADVEQPAVAPIAGPSIEELLDGYISHRESGKLHYGQADECLALIIGRLRGIRGRKVLTASTGEVFELVDNFADKNVAFGHGSVRRFDLKEIKQHK